MFIAIYEFRVISGKEDAFREGWEGLTRLIYENEGSLGSRLHHANDDVWVAYAQWPDRSTWSGAGSNMPQEADRFRTLMREACAEIKTVYELETMDDLLKQKPFDQGA